VRANEPFALDNGVFHPAGGASGQLSRQTPGFGTDRVTPVIEGLTPESSGLISTGESSQSGEP